jgi:2-keto-4-pentenoate hydratase/2-oxohepta-3-ene-1,7-dioic acid hydratase in catechol pathway
MRWIRYDAGDGAKYGLQTMDNMIEEVAGSPFVENGKSDRKTGRRFSLDEVRVLAPVEISSIFAPAQPNYRSHLKKHAGTYGESPKQLDFNYRGQNSIVGHGAPIVIPDDASGDVVFEGELAIVIGRRASHVTEEEAASFILGYTIANDVTDRGWQANDRTVWRAKNADTFCPIGPWIETQFDLEKAVTSVRLNGALVTEFPTADLIFGIPPLISALTRYVTLHAGDVILCGTDEPTLNISPGDAVEIGISGIGTLSNPVVKMGLPGCPDTRQQKGACEKNPPEK